ncbi:MAG TPA: hypothetical protein VK779_11390 [Rhizomicrobium sp.]|jgi:general secretion pathway protein J|nr:hypothetical protein [Rhizomicrobium sp.]
MKDRTAGYALIELIASLVILGMISTLMVSGVVAGRRVWERLDTSNTAGDSVSAAQMALRQRLEHVFPETRYDSHPPYAFFQGDTSSVAFLAEPRDQQRPNALRLYHLTLGTDGALTLASASEVAIDPNVSDDNQVLLRGVQSLNVDYYGPGGDGVPSWQLRWKEQPAPPQLIRIRVQFAPGDVRQWPDLLIKPVANVDSECVLNAATGKCRGRA